MQSSQKRSRILTAVFAVLVGLVVWILYSNGKPANESSTKSNYYHGVFRNKKDPNIWGDDQGHLAPPPADAIPYDPQGNPNQRRGPTTMPGQ